MRSKSGYIRWEIPNRYRCEMQKMQQKNRVQGFDRRY